MQNTHAHKNTVYIIIRCKKLIFVDGATHEIFLTTKISRSTVLTDVNGPKLVSIIQNSGVSTIEGFFLMY